MTMLGDLAYIGNHHVITEHKKPRGGSLTDNQRLFNCVLDHYRARVEHAVRRIRFHQCFCTPWRSSIKTLQNLLKVVLHTTAVDLELNQKYKGYSGTFGP